MHDNKQIVQTIGILKPENELFEVRIIRGKLILSGYFTSADALCEQLEKGSFETGSNFYITLNTINPDCYGKTQRDKFIAGASSTADGDIIGYRWLMIDIDTKRPKDVSATDEQLNAAIAKASQVYKYLRGLSFSEPIAALSGNGAHLLYPIAMKNTPENKKLIENVLKALDMLFGDEQAGIDKTTFNPSRVCKLYGTKAQKGANTKERPHRMSRITKAPDVIMPNDKTLLEKVADLLPTPEPRKHTGIQDFDLHGFMQRHGLNVSTTKSDGEWTRYLLDECVFNSAHKSPDAMITQHSSGAIGYHCLHNSCHGLKWQDVRAKFEPDAYRRAYVENDRKPNYRNSEYRPVEAKQEPMDEPIAFTTEQIRTMVTPPAEYITSGITLIDSKMRGLKKGFVSCISGLRSSGKSSVITQMALDVGNAGYRVALFSGEQTAKDVHRWMMLQAAGPAYALPTQHDNYYTISQGVEKAISQWYDGKIFIYNNAYGNDFRKIIGHLFRMVKDNKVDLIILDNLMALNVSTLDSERNMQQSLFVETLETFAKENNVHIVFVAHPRKAMGFLRLDDVSGSGDITNRVDNAFIVHRVNHDFRTRSAETFGWKSDNPIYRCSNVIEICKDRDGGMQDEFIPLHYDKTCKRLKNAEFENKVYRWEATYGT